MTTMIKYGLRVLNSITLIFTIMLCLSFLLKAQQPVPAHPQQKNILLLGGTIHVGDGRIIQDGALGFSMGKITFVGKAKEAIYDSGTVVIPTWGREVYPGLIAPCATVGLDEIEQVRAVNDSREIGLYNPEVRALIAYNTDSKVIPTVRTNGILFAQITPSGGIISGRSSLMELDGWNWEDAVYKADEGIHLNWPEMTIYDEGGPDYESKKAELTSQRIDELRHLFEDARAYAKGNTSGQTNLKLASMRGLFNGSLKLYIHASRLKEIKAAISFADQVGCKMVLVGGGESWKIATLLKEKNIPVMLTKPHCLPFNDDDDVDQLYKTPFYLQQAGVLFCLTDEPFWQGRNLPFEAGTAAAYGLNKEQALMSVSLNAAKIMGVDQRLGTLEVGKDASLFVSYGDALDMKTNKLSHAFIRGKQIDLGNEQQQLYKRYMNKYGLKIKE